MNTFAQSLTQKDIFNFLFFVPIFWCILHTFSGAYFNPYRKSRIIEVYRTLIISILGTILFYFFIFIDDDHNDIHYYYKSFFIYFILQFGATSFGRFLVLNHIKNQINNGKFGYNTLIIGGNTQAVQLYKEIVLNRVKLGYIFKGFVYAYDSGNNGLNEFLPKLGSVDELEKIIDDHHIEEIIIAIDTSEHDKLQSILAQLSHRKVIIKITPDLYDIISGSVKTSNVFGTVLIEIYPELMPDWQRVLKRTIDIVVSVLVMIIFSPLYIFAAIKVKLSSPGTIFYKQERIGIYGKPFWIYKFRSMKQNAEDKGPALSSESDPRITKWGKVMRKWRIDEIPQFFNILKGEMSLVGPRPERKYYIDIISETYPHYKYLHKVKPGLSSWGMVKYGYAENVNQMIERMKYDLLYIKNCSLVLDFKIMIYTIIVILQGRGK
ncbi:MAG: exopolysaccharide biosynthesis polyprenyl glycosylphosphotransferase [Bacteroidetes bacterium OLB11]|nr:MAG: exopolysaccharide biosynthesis polyprenyl glycosylphosphotransferase [Bacteroidetes bacterium OLB11]